MLNRDEIEKKEERKKRKQKKVKQKKRKIHDCFILRAGLGV